MRGDWIRWQLSVALWWLWLKVTPEHQFKRDVLIALTALRAKYPRHKEAGDVH